MGEVVGKQVPGQEGVVAGCRIEVGPGLKAASVGASNEEDACSKMAD
jgi:hypothetical protein